MRYQTSLEVVFVLEATLESFDRTAFRTALLARFSKARDALLTAQSSSVRVAATLLYEDAAEAKKDAAAIRTTSMQALSESLNVEVLSVSDPVVRTEVVFAPPSPPEDKGEQTDATAIVLAVVGTLVALVVFSCVSRLVIVRAQHPTTTRARIVDQRSGGRGVQLHEIRVSPPRRSSRAAPSK